MTQENDSARKDWKDEAEETLERAGESLRAAWDASRETRMSALEAARQAARQLAEAIDRGVGAAKERWATDAKRDEGATVTEEE
jgi:hypothetical protein